MWTYTTDFEWASANRLSKAMQAEDNKQDAYAALNSHKLALWLLAFIMLISENFTMLIKAVCGQYTLAFLCFHKNHPTVWEVEYLCSSGTNVIAKNIWQAMHQLSSTKQALQCKITLKILFVCLCYTYQSCIILCVYEYYVLYSCIKVDLVVEYTSLKFCDSVNWCVKCKALKLYWCCVLAILDFKKKKNKKKLFLYGYTCVVASGAIVLFILYVFRSFTMFPSPAWTCAGLQYWIKKRITFILLSNPLLKPPSQGL